MLRLKTPEYLRIVQSQSFEASYGGAEANVAAGLAMLKDEAAFVTKLPDNPVGQSALNELRCYGVDTSDILRGGKRLGIYYFEKGTNIRPTNVVYDREDSAFACSKADEYDWNKILADADVFFFSGVTPAVSETVKESVLMALQFCKEHGIEVVCDLNYRAKMWDKGTAQKVMRELMPYVKSVLQMMRILRHHLAFMRLMEICQEESSRLTPTNRECRRFENNFQTVRQLQAYFAVCTQWKMAIGWQSI